MKHIFCIYIALIAALYASAQDVIVLTNSTELKCKVISVDTAQVSYRNRRADTVYILQRTAVAAIRYADGSQLIVNLPSLADRNTADSARLMYKYNDYTLLAKQRTKLGIILSAISVPLVAGGVAVIVLGANADKQNRTLPDTLRNRHGGMYAIALGSLLTGGGVGLGIGGMSMFLVAHKYRRKAQEVKSLLSIAPTMQPIPQAGNIGGSYAGLAMRITF